jgi:TRAP-type mannitol/chloroaromatic compound transport system permease small subunit
MALLRQLVIILDNIAEWSGRVLAWLALAMALGTTSIVVLRYGFSLGAIGAQELITYLHGCFFMLGASYTLRHDTHVRVDVLYRRMSERNRAWINASGGVVFLLPFCAVLLFGSWHFVTESWLVRESSPEAGGIPAVFLLKSLIPAMAVLLTLQAISEILRHTLFLTEQRR